MVSLKNTDAGATGHCYPNAGTGCSHSRFAHAGSALLATMLVVISVLGAPANAIEFEDVSDVSLQGRVYNSESWGITMGDLNGDFWPDVVLGNHRNRASIYLNQGDGVLSNVVLTAGQSDATFFQNRFQDQHMLGLGDLDGDGDDDLGENRSHDVWYGTNGSLETSGTVIAADSMALRATECSNDDFYPLAFDDNQDFQLTFGCHRPARTFTRVSPSISHLMDLVNADLNGDGLLDLVAVRGSYFLNGADLVSSTRVESQFDQFGGTQSFSFNANPPIDVRVWPRRAFLETGTLSGSGTIGGIDFSLSGNTWTVSGSRAHIVVDAVFGITGLTALSDLRLSDLPIQPRYMLATGAGNWQDVTQTNGLQIPVQCVSVVSGDFDNDMDEDLYFGCRGAGINIPNRLYENNGQGVFTVVADAGGAAGVTGGTRSEGVGTTAEVVTGDYNNDGFLDLMVSNGHNDVVLRQGGPHELFRNKGNSNHWIQLKLRGTSPEFDALGAKVVATAGGITQTKLQNGGAHRSSQNLQRMHFGLGSNTTVDVTVTWPDAQVQTFTGLAADQIYVVDQVSGVSAVALQPVAQISPPSVGDECGLPSFVGQLDQALFLYRSDCGTNVWSVRIPAGGGSARAYAGQIVAENGGVIGSVTPVNLEANDALTASASAVAFDFIGAGGSVDGFNFVLTGDACLSVTAPSSLPIIVGPQHSRLYKVGINPNTMAPCVPTVTPELSINDISVNEGDGTVSATVTLSAVAATDVTFTAFSRPGTATGGEDFWGFSQNFVIPAGQIAASVPLTVLDDVNVEPTEDLSLRLTSVVGANVGDGSGVVSIADNDAVGGNPLISVTDITVNENNGFADLTLTIDQAVVASVLVFTRAGTATGGSDYFGFTRTVSFDGVQTTQTVSVQIINDNAAESLESFELRLTNAVGAQIAVPSANVTVVDDD